MKIILLSILLCLLPLNVLGTETARITGTYSDLHYNEEGGDLLGCEIRIVVGKNEEFEGTFQICEGGAGNLVLIKPVMVSGNKIKFRVPEESGYAGEFSGEVTKTRLKGTLTSKNGISIKLNLKRGKSYWD